MQVAKFLQKTNVRKEPSTRSTVLKIAAPNDLAWSILDHPIVADGHTWNQLFHIDGTLGWSAISNLSTILYTLNPVSASFERAVTFTLSKEGGYSHNPDDPGGETNYGISKRSYPTLDIKNITVQQAKLIYYKDYWHTLSCDALDPDKALIVFDQGVLTGVPHILSLRELPAKELLKAQLHYLTGLNGWVNFGRGWANRIADLIIYC